MEDRILIFSRGMLEYEFQGIDIRQIRLQHFLPSMREVVFDADVLIVFDSMSAKVLKNRLSETRLAEIILSNLGGYVASKIYRWEE